MCFRRNRSCRLSPAHQGMKMGVWLLELFAGHLPPSATPLDSRLRGNDDSGPRIPGKGAAARRDVRLLERAGHKATLEAAVFHFRSNDELRRRKDEMGGRRSAVWRQAESPEGDGYEREGEDDQGGHLQ